MADSKFSQIADGGAYVAATDKVLSVRSGTTDLLTTLGAAINVTVATEGTDTTCFPLFVTAITGDLPPKSNPNITYNSSTNALGVVDLEASTIGATTPISSRVYRSINSQTGTSYTLALTDGSQMVTLNNAAAISLVIPANASIAFPVGTEIDLLQLGAGQVNVTITSDTLNSYTSKTHLAGQFAAGTLKKYSSTVWCLSGNIA